MLHVTLYTLRPLCDRDEALRLWRALQRNLGHEARVALLLPDALHLLVDELPCIRRRISAVCGAVHPARWRMPVPPRRAGIAIADALVRRPVELGLVSRQVDWEFSTWRDAAGLTCSPWGDPGVFSLGPLPARTAPAPQMRRPPLDEVLDAVCTAARLRRDELATTAQGRLLTVQASARQGWDQPRLLASRLRMRPASVRRLFRAPEAPELGAVLRCLTVPACTAKESKPQRGSGILGPCSSPS